MFFAALVFAVLSGCGAVLGVDFSGAVLGEAEGGVDARSGSDDGASFDGASFDGATADAPAGGDGGTDARGVCDYPVAPAMVPVAIPAGPTFCIDATEVTQKDYAAFLAAKGGDTSGQIADCATNSFVLPMSCFDPAGHGAYPAACTDWCDAVGYCTWAGKHLCGRVGGGSLDPSTDVNTKVDEWFMACSHCDDGLHAFPYGTTAQRGLCNDDLRDAGPLPVGSLPGCVGGYDGLFDMSGNLDEWNSDCKPDHTYCGVRGGRYTNTPTPCGRDPEFGVPPTLNDPLIGFRCCADALR